MNHRTTTHQSMAGRRRRVASRLVDARGVTLIELLVVLLIIGVLAALALPSFVNQRAKAQDLCAKTQLRAAQSATIIYATESDGSFAGATLARLSQIESTVPSRARPTTRFPTGCSGSSSFAILRNARSNARCGGGAPSATNYCIRIVSVTGNRFTVSQVANGTVSRVCWVPAGRKRAGCPTSNRW